MASKRDLSKLDLYGILDVSEDATEKEILRAYRKRALKCHPDKNPDNPLAAEQFIQLQDALEVLTDAAAKAAYDKILLARKAAKIRQKQFDSKRKKFKDDLDARERAAGEQKEDATVAARRLQAEIERLRKEGSKILEEAQEQLRKDLEEKLTPQDTQTGDDGDPEEGASPKLKVKWKIRKGETRDEGYTKQEMMDMFSKFGEVMNLVMSVKKSGTAIVEFASPYMAELAVQSVSGKPEFPLSVNWLSGEPPRDRLRPEQSEKVQAQATPAFIQPPDLGVDAASDNKDFESVVLMKMRQAQERKRLIDQMMKEEGEGS